MGSSSSILLGGSQIWGGGIFPQPISTEEYNASEVYIMNINPNATLNQTEWKRVLVSGESPRLLEGVSLAFDANGGFVYLFGGRLLDRYICNCLHLSLSISLSLSL